MSRRSERALTQLARSFGIETAYEDVAHRRRAASAAALVRTLQLMGAPLHSADDAGDVLAELKDRPAADDIEPVIVAWSGRLTIPLTLSSASADSTLAITLRLEDGDVRTLDAVADPVTARVRGTGKTTHRVRVRGTLPLGYHDLEVEAPGGVLKSRIIAAPRRAFVPPQQSQWGLFMPVYALRSEDDWGIGSYSDLANLARWTAGRGGAFVGTLPLLPSFVDVFYDPSPYAPVSRLFWNELLIDVTRAPGWSDDLIDRSDFTHAADPGFVDYRAVGHLKTTALRRSAEAFYAHGDTGALDAHAAAHPRLRRYARFRAVLDRRRESWHVWPDRLRDGSLQTSDYAEHDERYHMYAQWVAHEQIDAIAAAARTDAATLYLDLPLGASPDGFDAWQERDLFVNGASTGAPPDALFTGGQNWGFQPPNPHEQRRSGHRYFIDCLRHHLRYAGMLRLDHVMSLHRLYWIPNGMEATDGVYVRYAASEQFAILTLESQRHNACIVGEDLGTVPRQVRSQMEKHRVLRMFVVQYELSADNADTISQVPRDVVASVNTHDMPTLRGFIDGSEIADQLDLQLIDEPQYRAGMQARRELVRQLATRLHAESGSVELLQRILQYLATSPARAVLINLEDLWLEAAPQNVPGTSTERRNWQRRAKLTLREATLDEQVLDTLMTIDHCRASQPHAGAGREKHG